MKRYFVKSHFTGWHEVTEKAFNDFCENIRKNATAIRSEEMENYIKTRTQITEE